MDTQGNSVNRSLLKATYRRGMKPAVRRFLGVPELPFRSSRQQRSMEQAMGHDAVIAVSVETLKCIAKLETSWKELEARATHSSCLSWFWIGTWLRNLPEGACAQVLVARTLRQFCIEHAVLMTILTVWTLQFP